MRASGLMLLATLMSLVAPGGAGAHEDASRPVAAVALVQPGGTWVTWTPGAAAPDHYVIYGGQDDVWMPIGTAPADAVGALALAVYPGYAVAAVTDGVETAPTVATTVTQGCVTLQFVPPAVSWGCSGSVGSILRKVDAAGGVRGLPTLL